MPGGRPSRANPEEILMSTPFRLLIDGALVEGASLLPVVNPALGTPFADAPRADAALLEQAVAAANRAFPAWAARPWAERAAIVGALGDAVEARADDFARLLTQEQGKPLAEAQSEVAGTVHGFRWYAQQTLPPKVLRENERERIVEHHVPLGVEAAITPWNFPLLLLMLKLAPALVTGNVVIGKPAPTTPLTTLLLGEVAADLVPAGVFQTLVDGNDLGGALSSHPGVRHVSFTGSTATGKKVLASTADTLKRFTLELGGNDAALVLDDADVARIAPSIFAAATVNAGQVCLATKRVYAPRALYDALCEALGEQARAAAVGDGLEQGTRIGPVQNAAQYEKLKGFLEEARAEGQIVAGGEVLDRPGYFIAPTVVRDLPDDARLVREEQFGPLLPVLAYDDLEAAIAAVNSTEYGLGGTVWSGDAARGEAVAARIDSGTVWVNRFLDLPFDIPFGGAKQSGIGRQQGLEGMAEFTQVKVINAAL